MKKPSTHSRGYCSRRRGNDRVTDNIEAMMPRIIAARRAARQGQHLTKPGRSATHFTEAP